MTQTTEVRTPNQRIIRQSAGYRARDQKTKAVAFSAFLVMLMLSIAITFTAISLKKSPPADETGGPGPGPAPLAFAAPITEGYSVLKAFSATQLQLNETHNRWQSHKAMSIQAPEGTSVLAVADGTVTAITNNTLYGTVVEITHSEGRISRYSSLDSNLAVSLERPEVRKGDEIGKVGTTSRMEFVGTPHLRLELKDKDGKNVDPATFIDFGEK